MRVTPTSNLGQSIETKRRRFTYSEVVEMTTNFQNILGVGGFGIVYHGYLNGSEQVAVKILSQSSSQGYQHFKAEVQYAIDLLSKSQKRIMIYFIVVTTISISIKTNLYE